jgi:hypothetical protein
VSAAPSFRLGDLCECHSGQVLVSADLVELIRQIENLENLEQPNYRDATGALKENVRRRL